MRRTGPTSLLVLLAAAAWSPAAFGSPAGRSAEAQAPREAPPGSADLSTGDKQAGMFLAGNDQALWMVRSSPKQKTYDVVAKPVDGDWGWIISQARGQPIAICATAGNLHVILADPAGYLAYDLQGLAPTGINPDDDRWPGAAPVTLCPADGLPGSAGGDVLAIVPRGAAATSNPASISSGPASRPARGLRGRWGNAPGRSSTPVTMGLFRQIDGRWRHVSDCPETIASRPAGPLPAAVAGKRLYILAQEEQARLLAYDGQDWRREPLDDWPAGARALGAVGTDDDLVLLVAMPSAAGQAGAPASHALALASYRAATGQLSFQPLVKDGGPVRLEEVEHPLLARMGDRLAISWQAGGSLMLAHCGLEGELQAQREIAVFNQSVPDGGGQQVQVYFMYGLMIAIIIPLFFMRSPGASLAFSLPAAMRAANPLRRLLAAMIDFLPWTVLSFVILRPELPASSLQEAMRYVRDMSADTIPARLAWFAILPHMLYAAYGTFMEYRFGATVGKMLLAMRVVGDGGQRPALRAAMLRNMIRIIEMSWQLMGLPVMLMLFTRNRQRLGDMMGRTAVIDTSYRPGPQPAPTGQEEGAPPSGRDESAPR